MSRRFGGVSVLFDKCSTFQSYNGKDSPKKAGYHRKHPYSVKERHLMRVFGRRNSRTSQTDDAEAKEGETSFLSASGARNPPSFQLPTQTRLKLSIRKWNVAARWRWTIGEGPCGICRETFDSCCVACRTPGEECPIAIGTCRHAFHMHCIVKWTKSQKVNHPQCPLCRQKWEFAPMDRPGDGGTT